MEIKVMANGPFYIKGQTTIIDKDGSELNTKQDTFLCRCGRSANKPYCDGTHREIEFD